MHSVTKLECTEVTYDDFTSSLHNAGAFSTRQFATAARSKESMLYFGKDMQDDELRLEANGQLEHDPSADDGPNLAATFWWRQPQKGLRIQPSVNGPVDMINKLHFAYDMKAASPITAMRAEVYRRRMVLTFGNVALSGNAVEFEEVPMQYDNEVLAATAISQLVGVHAAGITRKKTEDATTQKLKEAKPL